MSLSRLYAVDSADMFKYLNSSKEFSLSGERERDRARQNVSRIRENQELSVPSPDN